MGESRPSQSSAPDCQLLTEQPGKDLQTMGNLAPVNPERNRRVPAPFGFLCKKSVASLAEVMAAFLLGLIAAARLLLWSLAAARDGGPPLVSGCCGSPWAADRPDSGRFAAFLR
jgi:hypothetical protein